MSLLSTVSQYHSASAFSYRAGSPPPRFKTDTRTLWDLPRIFGSMNPTGTGHHLFGVAPTSNSDLQRSTQPNDVQLVVVQSPKIAKLAIGKEKDRKPMDPPPIVQLKLPEAVDHQAHFLNSPHYFMTVTLCEGPGGIRPPTSLGAALSGTHVSSLHRLKDTNNQDGAFFIFGDLSIKVEGIWALQFNLYEMDSDRSSCTYLTTCRSSPFEVQTHKGWVGMQESTQLTRTFAEQGVRLRLRKEPRTLLRQGGPASNNYKPRTYSKGQSQQSKKMETGHDSEEPLVQGSSLMPMQSSQYDPSVESISMLPSRSPVSSRPQQGRRPYSQHSDFEEPAYKRSRTDSGRQSSQFGQGQYANPQVSDALSAHAFVQPQYSMQSPQRSYQQNIQYGTYNPTQQNYGMYYAQSPQSASSYRGSEYDFARSTETISPYNNYPGRASHPLSIQPPSQFNQPSGYQQEITPTTTVRDSLHRLEVQSPLVAGLGGHDPYRQQGSPIFEGRLDQQQSAGNAPDSHVVDSRTMYRSTGYGAYQQPFSAPDASVSSTVASNIPVTTSSLRDEYYR